MAESTLLLNHVNVGLGGRSSLVLPTVRPPHAAAPAAKDALYAQVRCSRYPAAKDALYIRLGTELEIPHRQRHALHTSRYGTRDILPPKTRPTYVQVRNSRCTAAKDTSHIRLGTELEIYCRQRRALHTSRYGTRELVGDTLAAVPWCCDVKPDPLRPLGSQEIMMCATNFVMKAANTTQ